MDQQSKRHICELVAGIIATDGEFHPKELTFMLKTFEQFGVAQGGDDSVVRPTVARQDAVNRMLQLPEDVRLQALKLVIGAAAADGKVVPDEQKYLDAVAEAAGIDGERLEALIVDHLLEHKSG